MFNSLNYFREILFGIYLRKSNSGNLILKILINGKQYFIILTIQLSKLLDIIFKTLLLYIKNIGNAGESKEYIHYLSNSDQCFST